MRRVLTMSNGDLIVRPLQDNEKYVAISHTWGVATSTIEGIGWRVASWISLETCRALVEAYNNVWIDSLCIKQEPRNEPDKDAQIKNMHCIFGDAEYVVVVLTGDYRSQLTALRRLTQLLMNLRALGRECTSSRNCPYFETMEGIQDAARTVSEMPWFRRVWTLQEAIVPIFLTFVGFEGGKMEIDVTTEDELHEFTHAFDVASDVGSEAWAGSITHPCTSSVLDPLRLCKEVAKIVDSMRPVNLLWYKDMEGKDQIINLEYTADTVFKQLGRNKRNCEHMNDRVYGVCALLGIKVAHVDYEREFKDVFLEAVREVVKRGICVLPLRPQSIHGQTWLPSLEHVDLEDAWMTLKSSCVLNEELDSYHNMLCEGDRVYAKGRLIQIHNPCKLRTSMKAIKKTLQAYVKAVRGGKNFDAGSIPDPVLLTITCVVLWMYHNRGNDAAITTMAVESLIISVSNRMQMNEPFRTGTAPGGTKSFPVKDYYNILEVFGLVAPHITWSMDRQHFTVSQMVTDILECCILVSEDNSAYRALPLRDRDAILVYKKKFGLILCSMPSSMQTCDTYGFFYKLTLSVKVCEISCNVLALNGDGIWDNYGGALCWYITRVWDICKRRICVGTIR